MDEQRTYGFAPLLCNNPKIVILGTLPGEESLKVNEYYYCKSNRIWKVLCLLTNERIPKSNLPYEAIDDDEEREHQYPAEFEDRAELGDEIVECDRLIEQIQLLIKAVKSKYHIEDNETMSNTNTNYSVLLEHYFKYDSGKKKRYINWYNVILLAIIAGMIIWIVIKDID